MCGRFTITEEAETIEKRFEAQMAFKGFEPGFNIAPTQAVPVVLNSSTKMIHSIQWGMRPVWWKQPYRSLINIRLETLKEKPTFKHLFLKQRCLMIADGFYEWKKKGKGKQPYYITLKPQKLFTFPALWSEEEDQKGKKIQTCALITTTPNAMVEEIHDRMPCILEKKDEKVWLNEEDPKKLFSVLKSYPANKMKMFPVGPEVGSPKIDTPRLIVPIKL